MILGYNIGYMDPFGKSRDVIIDSLIHDWKGKNNEITYRLR
jgi:hypothetical protein